MLSLTFRCFQRTVWAIASGRSCAGRLDNATVHEAVTFSNVKVMTWSHVTVRLVTLVSDLNALNVKKLRA